MTQIKISNVEKCQTKKNLPKAGDYYIHNETNDIFIVCFIGDNMYILISIENGNRWMKPNENILQIFGDSEDFYDFTKINKIEIIVHETN
jgi:hypothetical protein